MEHCCTVNTPEGNEAAAIGDNDDNAMAYRVQPSLAVIKSAVGHSAESVHPLQKNSMFAAFKAMLID